MCTASKYFVSTRYVGNNIGFLKEVTYLNPADVARLFVDLILHLFISFFFLIRGKKKMTPTRLELGTIDHLASVIST